mmetsp:Transcript_25620/g.29567  ORF Transcript_25620/g.29567 Transcript_25620/m.29567 type:complete len:476 (+) Transcript_25620:108-1535(+)
MARGHFHSSNETVTLIKSNGQNGGSNYHDSETEEGPLPLDHELDDPEKMLLMEQGQPEKWKWSTFFRAAGPGIMVCLADTDGPCLITAAVSGQTYRYSLVLVQIILIPVLYAAQELTVRLGLATKDGITGLIRKRYGYFWAWFACTLHVLMCIQGQMSEFSSIQQLTTDVWDCESKIPVILYFGVLVTSLFIGGWYFRALEMFGLAAGSLQLVFVVIMFMTKFSFSELWNGLWTFHVNEVNYNELMAGNIGAVIMPWMLYYQQSALVQRKMKSSHVTYARVDTAVGSLLAQTVMLAMVVAMGATAYLPDLGDEMAPTTFKTIVHAFAPFLGSEEISAVVVTVGMTGACLVASIVLMITPVWSICEIMEWEKDLDTPFSEAPALFSLQFVGLFISLCSVLFSDVTLNPTFLVGVEIVNGLLILPVATFLWLLASDPMVVPKQFRLTGLYKWTLFVTFAIVCAYCLYGSAAAIIDYY